MAKLGINTGSAPNDGTGDTLLAAALKINQNFDEIYTIFGDGTNISGSVPYTPIAGFATYASLSGVSSYSNLSGVSTYSTIAGVSSYSNLSGVSTYSSLSGLSSASLYSVTSGVSTLSQGLTGNPNINVGVATATALNLLGNGTVSGILSVGTSSITLNGTNSRINVGSEVTIDGSTGIVSSTSFFANGINVGIITANTIIYEDSVLKTYWNSNLSGINTLSNVGIGSTLPTSKLTVSGDALFTGVVTALSFSGIGSDLSGVLKNVVEDTTPELGGNLDLNDNTIFGTGGINFTGVTTSSGGYVSGTINSYDYDILYATWGPITTENFRIRTLNNVGTNIPGIEFATSHDTSEIYVRQYTFTQSVFGAVENQLTLLNSEGDTVVYNNLGIGSTHPSSKLSVDGDGVFTGVVTASSFSGPNTLKSRTVVTGVTTSIANLGIGNTDITGFKSYALLKVGLSTAGWLRLYTDSTSRANDVSRSQGEDPAPGSGVIAEVITTGISTTQIISPFVMGGNLDNPADTTIYASITNLSGTTQAITANLTILQLEV